MTVEDAKRVWLRETLKQTDSPAKVVEAAGAKQTAAVRRCRCSKNLVSLVLRREVSSGEKAECVMTWASEVTGLAVHELFPNRKRGAS